MRAHRWISLTLIGLITVGISFANLAAVGTTLPWVARLDCHEDAVLMRSADDYEVPPNEDCWGWHVAHVYPLFLAVGGPADITAIVAMVKGGPGPGEMVDGFELQVLFATELLLSASLSDAAALLCDAEQAHWETILRFAAPCATGNARLIYWEADVWGGSLDDVAAVRIVAPNGVAVDGSSVWIEYERGG